MFAPILQPELQAAVLKHLQIKQGKPDLDHLHDLVAGYVRTVPWESAFRIVKRASKAKWQDCARWPEEFWEDNLQRGGGGTCFESNYAFSSLLNGLGYEGYLTINDMHDSIGCHAAIIVLLEGKKWLVDAGFPLYIPLPVDSNRDRKCTSSFQQYTVRPDGANRYQIERHPHPSPNAFTLIDQPVNVARYRQTTMEDYGSNGHFLDRVIVHKIVEEKMWRFNSSEYPPQLSRFENGHRFDQMIGEDVAKTVAAKFSVDRAVVQHALDAALSAGPQPLDG